MECFNRVELRGRVGSHEIELKSNGRWEGWFDLHVVLFGKIAQCFDCRVMEDGDGVKDLGSGIGGCFVQVDGRIMLFEDGTPYIAVGRLTVLERP